MAKRLNKTKNMHFGKQTSDPIGLWSPEIINQKIDYMHNNPVRAGFVSEPYEWFLSSANSRSPVKVLSL